MWFLRLTQLGFLIQHSSHIPSQKCPFDDNSWFFEQLLNRWRSAPLCGYLSCRRDAWEPLNHGKCISFQRLCVILRVGRVNALRYSDDESQEMFSLAKPVEFSPSTPKTKQSKCAGTLSWIITLMCDTRNSQWVSMQICHKNQYGRRDGGGGILEKPLEKGHECIVGILLILWPLSTVDCRYLRDYLKLLGPNAAMKEALSDLRQTLLGWGFSYSSRHYKLSICFLTSGTLGAGRFQSIQKNLYSVEGLTFCSLLWI